tara:strand:- start:707 stop:2044 length:1338 start_codon:yes stop_codon:yes gene_type:complete
MKNKTTIIVFLFILNYLYPQSYSLENCITIALEQKKTLLSSTLGVTHATKGLKGSLSNILPSIQATSSFGKSHFPEMESVSLNFETLSLDTIKLNHVDNYSTGISLTQNLYNGGQSRNQINQAKIVLDIAELNERSMRIMVIQNVIKSYYGLLQVQKLLDVSVKNLEMSNQQVTFVKKQFDLGLIKKTDLLKAEVAQGQARIDLLNLKTDLQNARRILFNDMGLQDFGQEITATDDEWVIPNIPSSGDLLKQLENKNPSLLVAEAQKKLDLISYKIIKGIRLPSIYTSLNYSANGETTQKLIEAIDDNWSFGINLYVSLPLYSGNSLTIQQQQAKIKTMQSDYAYITLLNDLRVQAELIRETLTNFSEIIPINRSVVESAEEDLKLVRERYSLGSTTILEVLDAQISLIRSNTNLITVVHNARIQEANLKALLGILDTEYKIKEE